MQEHYVKLDLEQYKRMITLHRRYKNKSKVFFNCKYQNIYSSICEMYDKYIECENDTEKLFYENMVWVALEKNGMMIDSEILRSKIGKTCEKCGICCDHFNLNYNKNANPYFYHRIRFITS